MDWSAILNGAIYGAIIGLGASVVAAVASFILTPLVPESARGQVRAVLITVLVIGGVVFGTRLLEKKFGPIVGPRATTAQPSPGDGHGP